MTATTATLEASITTRVPLAVQQTLEMAAGMSGIALGQFVAQAALHEAQRVIEQERLIRLSGREAEAFFAALESPPPPNAALQAALDDLAARHDDTTGIIDWQPRAQSV